MASLREHGQALFNSFFPNVSALTTAAKIGTAKVQQKVDDTRQAVLGSDYYKQLLESFQTGLDGLSSSFETSLSSALDKEFAASAKANEFTEKMNKAAMDFSAEQNELNRIFQQNSAQAAMDFSAAEAQKNRDWQEEMSNTSWQRAVADMQAAGLNPILAVTQGGASTPAGSAGSGYAASGSAASGYTAAASKADAAGGKNADTNYLSVIFNSAASLLNAIGEIIPG